MEILKTALITGVTGMDGSILSDILLKKGYRVFGIIRRVSGRIYTNIEHLMTNQNFNILSGDLADQNSLYRCIKESNPDEIYHLGAQSFVAQSFRSPEYTADITGLGTLRMLEAMREYGNINIKFYNASSSEMYGKMVENHANENTPFHPRSPYGVSKVFSYYMTKNYRETYGIRASNGILFNHESSRRSPEFLPRKITLGIKDIIQGRKKFIQLGNLKAKRDWGAAEKYCQVMNLMLQQDEPDDYVVATGQSHSIQEFLQIAFNYVGIDNWKDYVKINPKFFRPCEVDALKGDASKIKQKLGWSYNITFKELIYNMIDQEFGKPNKFL